jgi:PAS domain S-box-containing protein
MVTRGRAQGGFLRILVVDDDPGDRLLLAEHLELGLGATSFELVEAASFEDGLNTLALGGADLCFLDFRLGGRDGLELLEAARRRGAQAPVVLLTGHGDEAVAVSALKAGAVDYLRKDALTPELAAKTVRHAAELHAKETQRLEAEEALQRETRFNASILQASFDGVGVLTREGAFLYMNPAFQDLLGFPGEAPQGLQDLERSMDARGEQVRELLEYLGESLQRGVGREAVLPLTGKDGRRWRRLRLSPMPGGQYILNVQDVTALRERELRLEAYKRRLEEDLRAAAIIQNSLLPRETLDAASVDYGWAFHPAQAIGGDILNIYPLPLGKVGLYLIDVMGHGVSAAMLATTIHNFLHHDRSRLVRRDGGEVRIVPPGEVLEMLNASFPFSRFERYFTMAAMVLDAASGELLYANAGHADPQLQKANGSVEPLKGRGPFVGLAPETRYDTARVQLDPGDRVLLYSDGVLEMSRPDGRFFGRRGLRRAMQAGRGGTAQQLVDHVLREVDSFGGLASARDDISLLCAGYKAP